MATGFLCMTRILATAGFLICLAFSIWSAAHAQAPLRNLATDNGCFPWQDFRNGQCVNKQQQTTPPPAMPEPAPAVTSPAPPAPLPPSLAEPVAPPPPPPPVVASPNCPANTHLESGRCVTDTFTRAAPQMALVCDGGTATNGACVCPSGFSLMPAPGNAPGGTCARADAENCLGGELTVSGKCLCSGQVTMDGATYLLEYSNGKCLPMRCPVTALLQDGRCPATASPQLSSAPEPGSKPRPAKETRESSDEGEPRHHCERGMVYTRSGCVPARRRTHESYESRWRQYYQNYRYPGIGN